MLPCLESLTLYLIPKKHTFNISFIQKKSKHHSSLSHTPFFTLSPSNIIITPNPQPTTRRPVKSRKYCRIHLARMDVHPADGDPRTWCLAIRSKSPIRHGGNPKTALQPTSDEGCFESFPKDQWIKNLGLDLLTKQNIWKKSKNFTQILVLEDAAVGRSTLKYTLFSLGPGFWLEAWKFLHHPSPKSWVLSKLLGVVFQPSPTISNQYLICRAPTNTWKFRDICSNLFSLDVPPKKKDVKLPHKKENFREAVFFFSLLTNQQMKNPWRPGGHIPPETDHRKTSDHRNPDLEKLLVIPNLGLFQLPPLPGEMFEKHRWFPPKTWKFGKRP